MALLCYEAFHVESYLALCYFSPIKHCDHLAQGRESRSISFSCNCLSCKCYFLSFSLYTRKNKPVNKKSSRVSQLGFEPTTSGFLGGNHTISRLKCPDQLNWSIIRPIYYTYFDFHFANHTTTLFLLVLGFVCGLWFWQSLDLFNFFVLLTLFWLLYRNPSLMYTL